MPRNRVRRPGDGITDARNRVVPGRARMLDHGSATSGRKRWAAGALATTVVAGLAGFVAPPASADVRDGRAIEIFHGRNIVGLAGYPANTPVTTQVFRGQREIGFATLTTDNTGFLEINHVGGADCWQSQYTPDIRPGDVVRTSVRGEAARDTSVARDVFIRQNAQFLAGNIIRVTGHARGTAAAPIAGDDAVELRMNKVSRTNGWDNNGNRRDLRLEDVRPFLQPDGAFTYDFAVSADDWNDARTTGIDISTVYLHGVTETAEATELTFYDGEPEPTEGCPKTVNDFDPPTVPGNVQAVPVGTDGTRVTWAAARDDVAVTGYTVYRDGVRVATTSVTDPNGGLLYNDGPLPDGVYNYTVTANDATPNHSAQSAAASVTVGGPAAPPTNTPPTVSGRSPAINAVSREVAANITATFSEAVDGVTDSTFQVRNPAGQVLPGVVSRNGTTNQWILNPNANLAADTRYTVTLTGGTTAIRDLQGAALESTSAQPLTWSFTTGPAPRLSARTPGVNASGVSRTANITATFNEAVLDVSGTTMRLTDVATGRAVTAVVSYNATNRVATLNPSATLTANTQFRVNLTGGASAIRDRAGNPLASLNWSFRTGG